MKIVLDFVDWLTRVWVLCLSLYCLNGGATWTEQDLIALRFNLLKNASITSLTRNRCLSGSLKIPQSKSEPIFVCPLKIEEKQWGNRIGEYFEGVTCADIAGMHFINTAITFGNHSLFQAFPTVIRHPHPSNASIRATADIFRQACPGFAKFPYIEPGAWDKRLDMIKAIMKQAIAIAYPQVHETTLNTSSFDRIVGSSQNFDFSLQPSVKMIPDVAILFRCKDIVMADEGHPYGFLNFNTYTTILGERRDIDSIYILSEPLDYLSTQRHSDWRMQVCDQLGMKLVEFLRSNFPRSVVGLRRGFPADSIAILSHANTVICSPSTFCLWPGMINKHKVYLSSSVMHFLPTVSTSFHWIIKPVPLHFRNSTSTNDSVEQTVSAMFETLSNMNKFSFDACNSCSKR